MESDQNSKRADVAAYVWPSYTGDDIRARQFWPKGFGEWESVLKMKPKFEGHLWPRKPLWGYVNEADPRVMEMQIEAAASHGVNAFIYDWYWYDRRPFLENCLNDGFLKAANNQKMKFYLMWANHNACYLWDRRNIHLDGVMWRDENAVWLGAQDRNEFEAIVKRVIGKYFSRPNYYKIDGKPVFSVYDLANLVKGLGGTEAARDALEYFRRETERAGHKGLHLQAVLNWPLGFVWDWEFEPARKGTPFGAVVSDLGFDSATHYQFISFVREEKDRMDYGEMLPKFIAPQYEKAGGDCAAPYVPHVSVGWDNNVRYEKFQAPVYVNNTPENFEKALRMAKEYLDKRPALPRLVTVNSWNEWTEGSYLQPDDLYGYGYLEAVKKVFGAV
ncbi:MAG: glycoside hydrolase family 99-like domain-containing protein [Clostridiales bacterium]|jgi:hypothetical protein|nr:glycoside hydrolase family 99-like domain-containing protein [Clostridiales bacterium]